MEQIQDLMSIAKEKYDVGEPSLIESLQLAKYAIEKLNREATFSEFGAYSGMKDLPSVPYWSFSHARSFSRPIRNDLMLINVDDFEDIANEFIKNLSDLNYSSGEGKLAATKVIYTSVMAVAACFDLWKPGSRKTPGTYFEVLMGGVFNSFLPECGMQKFIPIYDENNQVTSNVSTDLVVFDPKATKGAVIPLKITTRERIVQPYAHQRILDSRYPGRFRSFLTCISETQLVLKSKSVNQICVPGTVKLYQEHLSELSGIYYADIPQRYASNDLQQIVPVKNIGDLLEDVQVFLYEN